MLTSRGTRKNSIYLSRVFNLFLFLNMYFNALRSYMQVGQKTIEKIIILWVIYNT
jgi:hypothetical protein